MPVLKAHLPIRGVAGNLILSQDVWACYHIRSRSYRAEPLRRRAALVRNLMAYAKTAEADFQILRVSRQFDPDGYIERVRYATPRGAHHKLWHSYLDRQLEHLNGLAAWTPAVFLCVRLADPRLDIQGRAARLFERTPREMLSSFQARVSLRDILRSQEMEGRARIAESRARACFGDARPARFEEVQWLIRRAYCRGLTEPVIAPQEAAGIPYEEPERAVKRWFGESGIDPSYRYLKSVGDYGTSYQVGACLGEMDHAQAFTREVELMFTALEDYPWPVDASLNVRYTPNDLALRRVDKKVGTTRAALEDEEQSVRGARGEGRRRVDLSEELHDRLRNTGEPILEGTLSFIVSATSLDEVNRRARALRESFPWPVYRPYGDQLKVWKQHLPGQPPLVPGYDRPFTIEQVGAMVPHATHEAGSSPKGRALYLARTRFGRQPVFVDLNEASGTNKAPTIALLGTLGSGKTITLQLFEWQAFLQGARIVDVDPKGDHRFHKLPAVAPFVQEIYLGPDEEHAGKLDPLRVAPPAERHDAAATFLIDVLPQDVDPKVHAAISGAISRVLVKHGERACCMAVVEELERDEREDEHQAGYMLKQYCDAGIARLGFAQLDDPLPSRADSQVVYLNVRALKRAGIETVRSEMTQSQRHGRAILQLVALYAMRILGEERNRLKVLAFDEASFLTEDALGKQLLDTMARWARSEYVVPILSSQLLGDVTDQDNLIGHWMLFGMGSRPHAVRALDALELDTEGLLVDALTEEYKHGLALYRDLQGRCEEIQIDPDPDLLAALSTTPVESGDDPDIIEVLPVEEPESYRERDSEPDVAPEPEPRKSSLIQMAEALTK